MNQVRNAVFTKHLRKGTLCAICGFEIKDLASHVKLHKGILDMLIPNTNSTPFEKYCAKFGHPDPKRTLVEAAIFIVSEIGVKSESELHEKLTEWTLEQNRISPQDIKLSWDESLKEIRDISKWAYKKFVYRRMSKIITIYEKHVDWILENMDDLSGQLVLLAFLKGHLESDEGAFFLGYKQLIKLTRLSNNTLNKQLKLLREKRVIEVVNKYSNSNNPKARQYRLIGAPSCPMDSDHVVFHGDGARSLSLLWFDILKTMIPNEILACSH